MPSYFSQSSRPSLLTRLVPEFQNFKTILALVLISISSNAFASILIPSAPELAAKSYILMDANTGKVITSYNAESQLPPASLTKMMTSYITTHELDKGTISDEDKVQVSVKAWKAEGSRMFIKEGDYVSVSDLLRGVIIQSGNDASIALAEYVAGSEDSFADLMNRYALEIGMESTHFMNATGLPHENHYTTAKDMAILAQAIINDHPSYYKMYAEKSFKYGGIKQDNRNRLINGELPVDGLKTGHTEEAGYCLVSSALKDGTRLISVVMGTDSDRARNRESKKLLTYGFRFYETATLYKKNEVVSTEKLWMGASKEIKVGVLKDMLVTIPKGSKKDLEANLKINAYIKAPIKQGEQLGTLSLNLDGKPVGKIPLVALEEAEKGGLFGQLIDIIILFFKSLLGQN